jgi:RNA polymerase sigma-32 factor
MDGKRQGLRVQDAMLTSEARKPYFDEIRRFPMLKADEEYSLAVRWRGRGDESAAHKLLTSHLRLVAKVAMGYPKYGSPISDLISEGNIGLMQAVKRFDPDRGIRFATYAIWWIRAFIQNYILRSWSLVKMGTTFNQRKLFFNLPKAKRRLSALEGGDLRPDQVTLIAKGLGVTEKEVVEMNRRLSGDVSLNVPLSENGASVEWQDRLVDEGSDQESCVAESEESETRRKALRLALMVLDYRERQIFEARRLVDPPLTLQELATKFCISRERIRQIEDRAFRKVRRAVHGAMSQRRHSLMTHRLNAGHGGICASKDAAHNGAETHLLTGACAG